MEIIVKSWWLKSTYGTAYLYLVATNGNKTYKLDSKQFTNLIDKAVIGKHLESIGKLRSSSILETAKLKRR